MDDGLPSTSNTPEKTIQVCSTSPYSSNPSGISDNGVVREDQRIASVTPLFTEQRTQRLQTGIFNDSSVLSALTMKRTCRYSEVLQVQANCENQRSPTPSEKRRSLLKSTASFWPKRLAIPIARCFARFCPR
ncbi:uncharacterized protein LOC144593388 [Rhinoraja longicauda]